MTEKQYDYLNERKRQDGDVFAGDIAAVPLKPNTRVWNHTLPDRMESRILSELQAFFVPFVVYAPSLLQPYQAPLARYQSARNYPGMQNRIIRHRKTDNYMVWSILMMVCCCWIFRIFAIVESSQLPKLCDA